MFLVFVGRAYAEMETNRAKSATPTRDHVAASSSDAAAADVDGKQKITFVGRSFLKRFALYYQTILCPVLSCPVLAVCDVGVLWPNGCLDHHETCHAGKPQPWPHGVRWGPSSPPPKGHSPSPPIFGPYLLWPNGWMH